MKLNELFPGDLDFILKENVKILVGRISNEHDPFSDASWKI